MKTLIGGAVAALLGVIGILVWWSAFLTVLAGTVPIILVLGGALAIYLGFDEMKDSWNQEEPAAADPAQDNEEIEKYKQEIQDLKQELETIKKQEKSEKGDEQ